MECRKLGITAVVAPAGAPGDAMNGSMPPKVLGADTLRAAIRHGLESRSNMVEPGESGVREAAPLLSGA